MFKRTNYLAGFLRAIHVGGVHEALTALFVDCDSYFASVEQHLDPRLRGQPVGVAPVMAETSCCIAASYEAKAFGVKTGTVIREARRLCPDIRIVESKPEQYIRMHHRIVAAVEECIHVEDVLSIDEMWARLPQNLREPDAVREIAVRIKRRITEEFSPAVTVSIGAGPNRYLAKTASKMRKPDGFFLIRCGDLPEVLHGLNLRDLNGIGRSLETRLHAVGIHTVAGLCAAPKEILRRAWGGVLGERFWHLIRGREIPDLVSARRSIGHSHVLPPDLRQPDLAWPVLCKLLHKACERLRSHGLLAGALQVHLSYLREGSWKPEGRLPHTDSTLHWMRLLQRIWRERPEPRAALVQVAVTLQRLVRRDNHTPDLFGSWIEPPPADAPQESAARVREDPERCRRLDETLDRLRARYGRDVVFLGTTADARGHAPMRISFTHIPDLPLESDQKPQPCES